MVKVIFESVTHLENHKSRCESHIRLVGIRKKTKLLGLVFSYIFRIGFTCKLGLKLQWGGLA